MIDLDDFKTINDTFGHAVGDEALVEFVDILTHSFRDSDVVARIGGDEFCVLLPDSKKDRAFQSVERVQDALAIENTKAGRQYQLRFSYGATDYDPHIHAGVSALLQDADANMYCGKRAKNAVKNASTG